MDMADNPFNIGYGEEEELDRPRLSMSRALNLDSDSGSGMFDAAGFIGDRNFQNPNDRNFMSYLFEGLADAGMVGDSFRRARQGKVDRIEFRNKQLKDAINMLPEDDQKIMALSEAGFFGKDPKTSESARQLALKMRNKRLLEESYKKADRENLEELRRREATKFDQAQEDREITLARNKEKYERDKKDYQRRLIKDKFKNSREIQKFLADPYNPPTQQMKDEVNEFRKLSGQAPYTENDFVSFQSKGKQKLFSELLKSGKVSNLSSTQIRDMTNNLPLSPEQKKEIQSKMLAQKDQKELDEAYSKFNKLVKNKYGLKMDNFLSTAFSDDEKNFTAPDAQVARHLLGGDKAAVESLLKNSTKVGASSKGLMRRFLKNFNNARLTRDNLLAKGSGRSKEENTELAKVENQIKNFKKVFSTWGKGIDENFFLGTVYADTNMPDEEKEEVKSSAKSSAKSFAKPSAKPSAKVEENEKPFSEVSFDDQKSKIVIRNTGGVDIPKDFWSQSISSKEKRNSISKALKSQNIGDKDFQTAAAYILVVPLNDGEEYQSKLKKFNEGYKKLGRWKKNAFDNAFKTLRTAKDFYFDNSDNLPIRGQDTFSELGTVRDNLGQIKFK